MRIALVGAHGVGKTTAANYLIDNIKDIKFIKYPEYAREIITALTFFDNEFSWKKTIKENPINYLLFESSLSLLYRKQNILDNFIADRTPLDILAYLNLAWRDVINNKDNYPFEVFEIMNILYERIHEQCDNILKNTIYDVIIYFKIKEGDSIRKFIDNFIHKNLEWINYDNIFIYNEKPNLNILYNDIIELISLK